MAKKFKINASDGSIKRYSDVVPQEKRRYWYFTTHGIGPGMLPSDVKILETKEGQNKKGTWGDFICLDSVLNTDELKAYDLIELAPDMVESACGSKKAVKSATRKPLRKQAVKADWVSKGKKQKVFKSFELDNFFLFELGKGFIGVSINNSYPDGKAWLGARTVKCTDADGLFAYLQKNLTDNATWNQIERTIANSGFEAKIDNMGGFVSDKDMNKPAKSVETACNKRRAVKASDVDADRPNSAPNSWKSSQRMAYKVTEDQTKGERTFPTSIDDVYKVLGEMQGTWTNPTTGWTGDCEIYERDLDDGSYIFSLVFGGNELEPDDILYVPGGFDYYSNKPKFTIYPHSGAPTFADSLEDFKRKLKKEYSYLRKVDDVNSACGKKKTVKASAVAKYKANRAIKAGINAPSTDGPLCVCENCKAEIESREGRQTVYNVISDLDIEPDERLICDWCEDEATELYQISPDDVEGAKKAVKCSFDEGDPWEYQESYDYYYDEEPPAHIAKELERLAKLTDMYQDRWFEKFEELHPGERFSSVDPHPDVDEAVGYTLDEAEYSPDEIKASTDVNASSAKAYYQITDEKLNIIDVANTEDEARAKALQILKDSGDEYYDIWYVDEDPDSIDDDVFIETVTASKSLNMKAGLGRKSDWMLRGYTVDGEDVNTLRIDFQDNVKQAITDMFANPDIDTVDVYRIDTEQDTTGVFEDEEYFNTFTRNDIKASTNVKADLQLNKDIKRKYNWGKNPITDLDGYVKDIADGVVDRFSNLTYEISDEAITFSDENNNVVYVQPIDEIVPEKEDLENDTEDLANAIQHEQEESDWYNQNTETGEDAFDYATRPVEMSTSDDELEPIMGDGFGEDDMGFGFDSNGDPISESMVDELERIAGEILAKSEIADIDEYADLHNFNYYASIPYIQESFDISFTYSAYVDELSKFGFISDNARMLTTAAPYDIHINVRCKNGEVERVDINDITEASGYVKDADLKNFNLEAIEQYIKDIVNPVAMDIYNGTTNI